MGYTFQTAFDDDVLCMQSIFFNKHMYNKYQAKVLVNHFEICRKEVAEIFFPHDHINQNLHML